MLLHAMVKKQLGGLIASLFSSGGGGGRGISNKEVSPCPSITSSSIMLSAASSSSSFEWQWPSSSCSQPRTLSLTSSNSIIDDDSFPWSASLEANEAAIMHALCSDRLCFEADESFSSSPCIVKSSTQAVVEDDDPIISKKDALAFGGATVMSVESQNPYQDFRESMEAMVISHGGGKDWRWLEEMLGWYLRANGNNTHGLIVGAFVDLLVSLSNTSSSSAAASDCSGSSDVDTTVSRLYDLRLRSMVE